MTHLDFRSAFVHANLKSRARLGLGLTLTRTDSLGPDADTLGQLGTYKTP